MSTLSVKKLGLAVGLTAAVFYLACVILMALLGQEATVAFFNTLMHGLEVSEVIRMAVPWWQSLLGLILFFILGWIAGALAATIYNRGVEGQ